MVLCSKTSTRKKADGEHGKQYHFYCTYVHTSLVYCSPCTISRQKVATDPGTRALCSLFAIDRWWYMCACATSDR